MMVLQADNVPLPVVHNLVPDIPVSTACRLVKEWLACIIKRKAPHLISKLTGSH